MENFNKDEFLMLASLIKENKLMVIDEKSGLKKVVKFITMCDTYYQLNIETEDS